MSSYQPPGIYVTQESPTSISATSPNDPSTVALVGPTLGYLTFTDTMVIVTAGVTLTQQGVNASTVSVASGNGTVYATSEYTVTQTGTGTSTVTTVTPTSGSTISDTALSVISYQYTNANYFTPQRFTSASQIAAVYGQSYSPSGQLLSPITFAAECLFANGTPPSVVVLPTTDIGTVATRTGLSSAYPLLQPLQDVYFIVPVASGITGTPTAPGDVVNVAADLGSYIDSLAPFNQYALGLYAPDAGSSVSPATIAGGVANRHVATFYPNSLLAYSAVAGQTVTVGGFNLAAAAAGFLSVNPVQQGITARSLNGFSGFPTSVALGLTQGAMNTIAAAGVSVFAPNLYSRSLQIRQSLTTDQSSPTTGEISVVRINDWLIYDLTQTFLNSAIIGSPLTPLTVGQIASIAQGVLEALQASGAILGYQSLSVSLSATIPTTATVAFQYLPAYPVNYIDVNYTIDTSTGSVSAASAAA